jgi:PBP1b-binding outer membrane lipoprotein LpoB
MRSLTIAITFACFTVAGCSQSTVQATVDSANAAGTKLMSGVVQKDASTQVEGLIRNLKNDPDCDVYKERLREVGHGSPYEGATQSAIVRTYDAAGKAGCVRPY